MMSFQEAATASMDVVDPTSPSVLMKNLNIDDLSLENGWTRIVEEGIKMIISTITSDYHRKPFSNAKLMELNSLMYSLSGHNSKQDYSKVMYDRYKDVVDNYMKTTLQPLLVSVLGSYNKDDVSVAKGWCTVWGMVKSFAKWMSLLFRFLDKGVVLDLGLASLQSCVLESFFGVVYIPFNLTLKHALLELAKFSHQSGLTIHCTTIQIGIQILIDMGDLNRNSLNVDKPLEKSASIVFFPDFESDYMLQMCSSLRQLVACRRDLSFPDFIHMVETLHINEMKIASQFLPGNTLRRLEAVLIYELLVSQCSNFLESMTITVEQYIRLLLNVCTNQNFDNEKSDSLLGGISDKSGLKAVEDLGLTFRLFAKADKIFPQENLYQFEHKRKDSVESQEPYRRVSLQGLLGDDICSAASKIGRQLLADYYSECNVNVKRCRSDSEKKVLMPAEGHDVLIKSLESDMSPSRKRKRNVSEGLISSDVVTADVCSSNKGEVYVSHVMTLLQICRDLTTQTFGSQPCFVKSLQKMSKAIFNLGSVNDENSSSKLENQNSIFAAHCDRILSERKQERIKLFTEIVFPFLDEKDAFLFYLRRLRCRKLLRLYCQASGRGTGSDGSSLQSIPIKHDRLFLDQVKQQCGNSSVTKLECMLKDVTWSDEMNLNFIEQDSNEDSSEVDDSRTGLAKSLLPKEKLQFHTLIATPDTWPALSKISDNANIILPPSMENYKQMFGEWFRCTHSKRLRWIYSHGEVSLLMRVPHNGDTSLHEPMYQSYELLMTPLQATVLYLFNSPIGKNFELKFHKICELSGLSPEVVQDTLGSLVDSQQKVLVKCSQGEYRENCFSVNRCFVSDRSKCRLSAPSSAKKKRSSARKLEKELSFSRKETVEAVIVRSLKGGDGLNESDIFLNIQQKCASSTFKPNEAYVRQCLESLVEREYIELLQTDPIKYIYCD